MTANCSFNEARKAACSTLYSVAANVLRACSGVMPKVSIMYRSNDAANEGRSAEAKGCGRRRWRRRGEPSGRWRRDLEIFGAGLFL